MTSEKKSPLKSSRAQKGKLSRAIASMQHILILPLMLRDG